MKIVEIRFTVVGSIVNQELAWQTNKRQARVAGRCFYFTVIVALTETTRSSLLLYEKTRQDQRMEDKAR